MKRFHEILFQMKLTIPKTQISIYQGGAASFESIYCKLDKTNKSFEDFSTSELQYLRTSELFSTTFKHQKIQDGPFRGCLQMRGPKKSIPLWNLSHISYNYETSHSYTLPKVDWKNAWVTWHIPCVLLRSACFTGNQQIFPYQEIRI